MASEYIVGDSIVACLTLKAPVPQAPEPRPEPWFRRLSRLLRMVCSPHEDDVKFFEGRAYCPVYANNLDPETSCSWTETADGGGFGQVVLAWADQPKMRVRVTVKLAVAKDGHWAWLTVGHNPTTLVTGRNIHPAGFVDPHTGVADIWPSSSWAAMTRAFRLGFTFLEAMSEPDPLFDAATKRVIARGDVHLVSVQYAATKAVTNVTDFLQVGTVIYGQTIARGKGIVNNAKHLGLRFKPFHPRNQDPNENWLSGFMLQKLHGKKLHLSVAFYDKLVRLQQMHQEGALSLVEAQDCRPKRPGGHHGPLLVRPDHRRRGVGEAREYGRGGQEVLRLDFARGVLAGHAAADRVVAGAGDLCPGAPASAEGLGALLLRNLAGAVRRETGAAS
jgi:hypothetical protein